MKKKLLAACVAAVLALGITACGGAGAAQNDAAAPADTQAAETSAAEEAATPAPADGDSYTIVVSTSQAAQAANTVALKEACESMTNESGGRLQFEIYDSGNLLSVMDSFKGVQDGVADIVFCPANVCFDYFPLNARLIVAPFMGYKSGQDAYDIYQTLREEFPEISTECEEDGIVNLGVAFNEATDLYAHDKKFNVTTIDDLKGKKIGVSDSYLLQFMEQAGATATFVTNADIYTSIDNGVVDGVIQHPGILTVTGCADTVHKVVKFGDAGLCRSTSMFLMNKSKYDSLPEDLQGILKAGFDAYTQTVQDIQVTDSEKFMGAIDAEVTELSAEEIAPFAEKAKGITETIISEAEAAGYPAQAIYDRIQELNQQ